MDVFLSIIAKLAAILALTLLNAFIVASEYALITLRRTRIDHLAADGHRAAQAVKRTLDELGTLLAATQLGVTIIALLLGALAEPTVARVLDPLVGLLPRSISRATVATISVVIAFTFITALDIVVGELAPKAIGLYYNEQVAFFAVRPMRAFIWLFRPFLKLLETGGRGVARLAGVRSTSDQQAVYSQEELQMLVMASTSAGILKPEEERMLIRVFEFSRLAAHQVMVPRTEIVAVPANVSPNEVFAIMANERHSRLPVYEETLDNIVGILYLRDLLNRRDRLDEAGFDVRRLMREPLTVPETMQIDHLLRMMRLRRIQMAIAIDEFGGTAGLVTLEDLLERIVGELQDEFEPMATEIEVLPDGSALIDGLTLVDDVNDRFDLHLDGQHYDTIGGYVFGELGRRAVVGDEVQADGHILRVVSLDGLRVARVHLLPAKPSKEAVGS